MEKHNHITYNLMKITAKDFYNSSRDPNYINTPPIIIPINYTNNKSGNLISLRKDLLGKVA